MGLVTASGPSPAPNRVFSSAGAQAKFGACAPQSVSQSISPLGRHHKFLSLFLALAPLRARKPTRKATNTDYLAADCPARARPSSYFPIVGFPRLPCACALFSRPRLPRYQPRHRVASCCWHPPSAARAFCVIASRRATSRVRLTPRGSPPVCFPTRTCQELTSEQDPRIQGAKTNQLETLSATDQPTPRHKLRHTLEVPFVNLRVSRLRHRAPPYATRTLMAIAGHSLPIFRHPREDERHGHA